MNIKIDIPTEVQFILKTLENNKFKAFIVGGCVRDSIMNIKPHDWDITTNALPEQIIKVFKNTGYNIIPTGLKHGTISIMIHGEGYEITTFRIDGVYNDCRHPNEVIFTEDIIEDLSRRDFTINAMAIGIDGQLIDPFHGIKDIENKMIKCVGNPLDRFNEDALRMMRAIRFSCKLGFEIEQNIINSICDLKSNIQYVSTERIRDEFCKILISDNPANGMCNLIQTGIMKFIIPELIETIKFNQYNIHHDKDVFWHTMSVMENIEPVLELRLSALLHDIGKPQCFTIDESGQGHFYSHQKISSDMAREVLRRLKFDNKTIDKVSLLVYEHMSRYDNLRTPNIKKFINRVGINNLESLFSLQIADIKGCAKEYRSFENVLKLKKQCYEIINEKQPLTVKDLEINGNDLINLGIKQGKEIGNILNKLLEIVLESPNMNDKNKLLDIIKKEMIYWKY